MDRRAKERTIEVRGRDASSGLPKMVAVNSLEIQRALEAQVMNILEGIKSILEKNTALNLWLPLMIMVSS